MNPRKLTKNRKASRSLVEIMVSNEPSAGPLLPGKYAIIAIGLVAVLLASAGVWYQYRLQHRPLTFWGTETAQLILAAPDVEALRLAAIDESGAGAEQETLTIDGHEWAVVERREVSEARGFTHVRRALVMDGSFEWEGPSAACEPTWRDALRFVDGPREAIVALAFDCPRAMLVGRDESLSIQPVADGLQAFMDEQFLAPVAE